MDYSRGINKLAPKLISAKTTFYHYDNRNSLMCSTNRDINQSSRINHSKSKVVKSQS